MRAWWRQWRAFWRLLTAYEQAVFRTRLCLTLGICLTATAVAAQPRYVLESESAVSEGRTITVFRDVLLQRCHAVYVDAGVSMSLGTVPCEAETVWQRALDEEARIRERATFTEQVAKRKAAQTERAAQARRTRALYAQLEANERKAAAARAK